MKVVTAWSTPSSQGTHTYESVLYDNGSASCDCPGWTIKKRDKPRGCTHTTPGKAMPLEAIRMQAEILGGRTAPEADITAIKAAVSPVSRSAARITRPLAQAPSRTANEASVADFLRRRRAIGFE